MRKLIVACLMAGMVAGPASASGVRDRYSLVDGRSRIHSIIVRHDCLGAEDSAGHLRMVDYDPAHGRVVLGCGVRGY